MHITSMLGLMYICKNVRECVLACVCTFAGAFISNCCLESRSWPLVINWRTITCINKILHTDHSSVGICISIKSNIRKTYTQFIRNETCVCVFVCKFIGCVSFFLLVVHCGFWEHWIYKIVIKIRYYILTLRRFTLSLSPVPLKHAPDFLLVFSVQTEFTKISASIWFVYVYVNVYKPLCCSTKNIIAI